MNHVLIIAHRSAISWNIFQSAIHSISTFACITAATTAYIVDSRVEPSASMFPSLEWVQHSRHNQIIHECSIHIVHAALFVTKIAWILCCYHCATCDTEIYIFVSKLCVLHAFIREMAYPKTKY